MKDLNKSKGKKPGKEEDGESASETCKTSSGRRFVQELLLTANNSVTERKKRGGKEAMARPDPDLEAKKLSSCFDSLF